MIDYSISLTVERIISAQNLILETFQTDGKKVSSQSTQVESLYIPTSAINEDKESKIFPLNYSTWKSKKIFSQAGDFQCTKSICSIRTRLITIKMSHQSPYSAFSVKKKRRSKATQEGARRIFFILKKHDDKIKEYLCFLNFELSLSFHRWISCRLKETTTVRFFANKIVTLSKGFWYKWTIDNT